MAGNLIIKLGGSLLSHPGADLFDFGYLARLKKVLTDPAFSELKFFLAIGGGHTMRKYRDLAKAAGVTQDIELHWIGTTVNVLHAFLVKAYFADIADSEVVKYEDYYQDRDFSQLNKIKVGGGGRPGHSGDVDALLAAQKLGATKVISLKNVDGVYEADPKENPNAKRLDKLTWDEYLAVIGHKTEHEPGGNYPIDPIASRMAQKAGMEFVVISGNDLVSLRKCLLGESFVGTIVAG